MSHPTLRRRHTERSFAASISSASSSADSEPSSPPPRRPRAYSFHPSSPSSSSFKPTPYGSSLLNSLDLSGSMFSLRQYLIGKLEEAEEAIRALKVYADESSEDSGDDSDQEDDDERWEIVTRKHGNGAWRRPSPPLDDAPVRRARARPRASIDSEIGSLSQFITTATGFLSALRAELPSIPGPSSSPSLVQFQLSPDARLALDDFLLSHPIPSFPHLDLRARLDGSKVQASSLISYVAAELRGLQEVFAHLTNLSHADPLSSYIPSLPSLPPLPTPPLPPISALRSYFRSESDRLHSSLPSTSDLTSTVSKGLYAIRDEATELTSLLSKNSSAALDEAARMYHAAVEGGRKRLLRYEELPHEWRNNEHILSGYRFIASESWGTLLRSGFEYHNETINIQSHFIGTLTLIYLLVFLFPNSPHASPDATWADAAIAVLFVGAAIKCLVCSTAWHLCSGTADLWWHRSSACVDYVGISALIAASVMGMEYYGFYCRPALAVAYMSFSATLGIAGMILPWKPWFNERAFKMWRISFFVGLAASAVAPMAHMACLYGLGNTVAFFTPALPSVLAYLVGLSFYANQFPECAAPGRWDNLFASHQVWHGAIVVAVWMHWHAMNVWAVGAQAGTELSCLVRLSAERCPPGSLFSTITSNMSAADSKPKKRALCSIGVDVDAVSGWLGSYGGEDSPNDISRGMFAGTVGCPRLLKCFDKYGIKTTWFIPGHSLDTFPDEMAAVRDAGHEIGLHGYSHENPIEMSIKQQTEVLEHTFKQLTDFCGGKPPVGSVAPWWETSREGVALLLEKGIQYDHSSQAHDCQPFYCRDEDTWTKINYKAESAKEWMKPLVRGNLTGMVQIPANWYLDDLPPHMFIKGSANSHGFVDADVTLKLWKKHFDYFYREEDWFVFPLTIHPDVSGRPHIILIIEELIEYINGHEGVEWVTMKEINDEFRARNPPPDGAAMPKGM